MAHDVEIDLSDLGHVRPAEIRFARKGVLAAVECDSVRLRIPLSIYHCTSVRREIERQLATHELCPQWHLAHHGVDLAGAPIRYVSVAPSVDAGWS